MESKWATRGSKLSTVFNGNEIEVDWHLLPFDTSTIVKLDLNGTSTPEPGGLLLLGTAPLGAIGALRRKINLYLVLSFNLWRRENAPRLSCARLQMFKTPGHALRGRSRGERMRTPELALRASRLLSL